MDGFHNLDEIAQGVLNGRRSNRRKSISQDEMEDALRQAGWDEKDVPLMSAIGMGESSIDPNDKSRRLINSFNPGVGHGGKPTNEKSYGIWQINMVDPNRQRKYDKERLATDPVYNAQVALDIFKNQKHRSGNQFNHWGAYFDGNYKKFLRNQEKGRDLNKIAQNVLSEKKSLNFSAIDEIAQRVLNPTVSQDFQLEPDPNYTKQFEKTDILSPTVPTTQILKSTVGFPAVEQGQFDKFGNPNKKLPENPIYNVDENALPTRPRIVKTNDVTDDNNQYAEWLNLSGLTHSTENQKSFVDLMQNSQNQADILNQKEFAKNNRINQQRPLAKQAKVLQQSSQNNLQNNSQPVSATTNNSVEKVVNVDLKNRPRQENIGRYMLRSALELIAPDYGFDENDINQELMERNQFSQWGDKVTNEEADQYIKNGQNLIPYSVSKKVIERMLDRKKNGLVSIPQETEEEKNQKLADDIYGTDEQQRQKIADRLNAEKQARNNPTFGQTVWDALSDAMNPLSSGLPNAWQRVYDNFTGQKDTPVSEDEINTEFERQKKNQLTPEEIARSKRAADVLNNTTGGLLGAGAFGGAGRTISTVAGILRPFSSLGFEFPENIGKAGKQMQLTEQMTGDGSFVSNTTKTLGGLGFDLARLGLLSRLPGGAVIGFSADSALQSAGRGESLKQIQKEGTKGAAMGGLFPLGAKAGQVVSKIAPSLETITRLGTIGAGTTGIEYASGTPIDKAVQSGIMNVLFDAVQHSGGKVLGKIGRIWKEGKPIDVEVKPSGDVSLVRFKGEENPNRVDFELVLDPTDNIYKTSFDINNPKSENPVSENIKVPETFKQSQIVKQQVQGQQKPDYYFTNPEPKTVPIDQNSLSDPSNTVAVDITKKPSGMNLGEFLLRQSLKANQEKYGFSDEAIEKMVQTVASEAGQFGKNKYPDLNDEQFKEMVLDFQRKNNGSTYINYSLSKKTLNKLLGGDENNIATPLLEEQTENLPRLSEADAQAKTEKDLIESGIPAEEIRPVLNQIRQKFGSFADYQEIHGNNPIAKPEITSPSQSEITGNQEFKSVNLGQPETLVTQAQSNLLSNKQTEQQQITPIEETGLPSDENLSEKISQQLAEIDEQNLSKSDLTKQSSAVAKDDIVFLNPHAAELIRHLSADVDGQDAGSFLGQYMPPQRAENLLTQIYLERNHGNHDSETNQKLKEIEEVLQGAVDSEHKDLVLVVGDENSHSIIQEETAHRADYRTREFKPADISSFREVDGYLDALGNVYEQYGDISLNVLHNEVVAKTFRNDAHSELGIEKYQVKNIQKAYQQNLLDSGISSDKISKEFENVKGTTAKEFTENVRKAGSSEQSSGSSQTDVAGGGTEIDSSAKSLGTIRGTRIGRSDGSTNGESATAEQRTGILEPASKQNGVDFYNKLEKAEQEYLHRKFGSDLNGMLDASEDILLARPSKERPKTLLGKAIKKMTDGALDIISLPQAVKSSVDISAPGRQGAVLTLSEPKIAVKSFIKQLQSFSESRFEKFKRDLNLHPSIELAEESRLYLSTLQDNSDLTKREEAFISRLVGDEKYFENKGAEMVRRGVTFHIRASERAYQTYLDSLRIECFSKFASQIHDYNVRNGLDDSIDQYEAVADFINKSTGRGDLGVLNDAAPLLNTVFFSVRNWVSRFQLLNPAYYAKLPPSVRKIALTKMLQFGATTAIVMALLKAAGADIQLTDTEEGDWLKVSFRPYHYDLGAGFIQPLRLIGNLYNAASERAKGKNPKVSEGDLIWKFLRTKFAPVFGSAVNLYPKGYEGKNVIGEKVILQGEALGLITPMSPADLWQAGQRDGTIGVLKALPVILGEGLQIYDKKDDGFSDEVKKQFKDLQMSVPTIQKKIKIDSEEIELTQDQQKVYQQKLVEQLAPALEELTKTKDYQELPEKEKKKVLQQTIQQLRSSVNDEIKSELYNSKPTKFVDTGLYKNQSNNKPQQLATFAELGVLGDDELKILNQPINSQDDIAKIARMVRTAEKNSDKQRLWTVLDKKIEEIKSSDDPKKNLTVRKLERIQDAFLTPKYLKFNGTERQSDNIEDRR